MAHKVYLGLYFLPLVTQTPNQVFLLVFFVILDNLLLFKGCDALQLLSIGLLLPQHRGEVCLLAHGLDLLVHEYLLV